MEATISRLEEEKANLEKEVSDLKRSCEMIEKRAAEQKVADEKNHSGEFYFHFLYYQIFYPFVKNHRNINCNHAFSRGNQLPEADQPAAKSTTGRNYISKEIIFTCSCKVFFLNFA